MLRHGESALLAPFNDAAAFVSHAESLARDPGLARALGREARKRSESLTWECIVQDFEAVLLDVAA